MAGFWKDANFEIKRSFKWVVIFGGTTGGTIPSFIASKVTKPSLSIGETEHNYLNHKFYYPGQVTWNDVSMTLVDPLEPDAARLLLQRIKEGGYRPPENKNDLTTISKAKSVAQFSQIKIQQLDAQGTARETWVLWNAWPKDVKFGDLDYSSEDMVNIELTFKYDYAWIDGLKQN